RGPRWELAGGAADGSARRGGPAERNLHGAGGCARSRDDRRAVPSIHRPALRRDGRFRSGLLTRLFATLSAKREQGPPCRPHGRLTRHLQARLTLSAFEPRSSCSWPIPGPATSGSWRPSYYSITSYMTGYGDLVLPAPWRFLG